MCMPELRQTWDTLPRCCGIIPETNPKFLIFIQVFPLQDYHDDVIKWRHFPRYWPFVRGIHRSPVNSQHKGQWRGALMFSLICIWLNDWVNNREAGDLRRHRAHCDVIVMTKYLRNEIWPFRLRIRWVLQYSARRPVVTSLGLWKSHLFWGLVVDWNLHGSR